LGPARVGQDLSDSKTLSLKYFKLSGIEMLWIDHV